MTDNNKIHFRKADYRDIDNIWEIIQQAIERRKNDGSSQWQNGYPNLNTIQSDVCKDFGYVLTIDDRVAVYTALIQNDEPAYSNIDGEWLSNGEFVVVHRVAVHNDFSGKGLVKILFDQIENFTTSCGIQSVKVDTNFDNTAMLKILESKGYIYCGEVFLAGGVRKAYEKIIS
ncbi:GNAT family N-acetyltransferase [Chryseobacterium echinoideorum]|uniref:GNAT family N-acetyltransferase n=1 Tax=Chryseobacterium echinoideorum TaxID=1549648 RepID=UPI001186F01F|nr:GNAT family N-acetyltransferase [Chryseobacterium echinoideorum]